MTTTPRPRALVDRGRTELATATTATIAGLLLLFWPGRTMRSLVLLTGAFLLVEGILSVTSSRRRGWLGPFQAVTGLAGAIAGAVLLLRPGTAVSLAAIVLAGWALLTGVGMLVSALFPPRPLGLFAGAGLVALGVVFLLERHTAMTTLAQSVGAVALLVGIAHLLEFRRSRAARRSAP